MAHATLLADALTILRTPRTLWTRLKPFCNLNLVNLAARPHDELFLGRPREDGAAAKLFNTNEVQNDK